MFSKSRLCQKKWFSYKLKKRIEPKAQSQVRATSVKSDCKIRV